MPYFECDFPNDFLAQLKGLENTDEVCEKMLKEASPILVDSLASEIRKNHVKTGDLWKSIEAYSPRKTKDGYWVVTACPTGRAKGLMKSAKIYSRSQSGTMTSGQAIYNDDKLWFLEKGTSKQPPSPVLVKATNRATSAVLNKMQETYNKEAIKR